MSRIVQNSCRALFPLWSLQKKLIIWIFFNFKEKISFCDKLKKYSEYGQKQHQKYLIIIVIITQTKTITANGNKVIKVMMIMILMIITTKFTPSNQCSE